MSSYLSDRVSKKKTAMILMYKYCYGLGKVVGTQHPIHQPETYERANWSAGEVEQWVQNFVEE